MTIELNLSDELIANLKRATGKHSARAAVSAALHTVAASRMPASEEARRRIAPLASRKPSGAVRAPHFGAPGDEIASPETRVLPTGYQQPDKPVSMREVKALRRRHRSLLTSKEGMQGYAFLDKFSLEELLGPL